MRRATLLILCLVATGFSLGRVTAAEGAGRRLRQHVWGQFQPGSWRVVRVVTETLDPQGNVTTTSTSETRTLLETVSDRGVTLKNETTVEVAGKKLAAPPQSVSQGLYGEPTDQPVTVKEVGADNLTIAGKIYPCRLEQIETTSATGKVVSKIWRSDDVAPYVLKKETTTITETGAKGDETTVEVVSLGRVRRVLARMRDSVELRLEQRNARGRTVTQAWQCEDVPGGIVAQQSEEFDANDRLVRRSKLELIDYQVK